MINTRSTKTSNETSSNKDATTQEQRQSELSPNPRITKSNPHLSIADVATSLILEKHMGLLKQSAENSSKRYHRNATQQIRSKSIVNKLSVGKNNSIDQNEHWLTIASNKSNHQGKHNLITAWGRVNRMAPYQSLSSRMSEAVINSESFIEFVCKATAIVFYTRITIMLIMFAIMHAMMFFFGVKYINECPAQPKLPIYILVTGAVGLLKVFSLIWQKYKYQRKKRNEEEGIDNDEVIESNSTNVVTGPTVNIFLFAWFLAGNVWAFRIYKPRYIPEMHEPSNCYVHQLIPYINPVLGPMDEINKEEVTTALNNSRSGMATGTNNIPSELWKSS
ncbi:hypothetical protein GJ496_002999 [Pomphorhynchus laevis]|nr:hypothetical protein GJ496_002999 [Pomphorhynchus laevis]